MKTILLYLLLFFAFSTSLNAQVAGFKFKNLSALKTNKKNDDIKNANEIKEIAQKIKDLKISKEIESDMGKKEIDEKIKELEKKKLDPLQETRRKKKIKDKKDELAKVLTSLNNENLSDEEFENLIEKKVKIENDTLYINAQYNLLNDNFTWFGFNSNKANIFYDLLYENKGKRFQTLSNSGLNFGNSTASIFTELISGNFGIIRASFGTMVSSSSSKNTEAAIQEEAYQKLATYGGNTVLNLEYPFFYGYSESINTNFMLRARAKGTADLPVFGTTTENWAGSASVGLNFYIDIASKDNNMSFFLDINSNFVWGTDEFSNNLQINHNNVDLTQITVGTQIAKNFKISIIIFTISDEKSIRNSNIVLGGQVLK